VGSWIVRLRGDCEEEEKGGGWAVRLSETRRQNAIDSWTIQCIAATLTLPSLLLLTAATAIDYRCIATLTLPSLLLLLHSATLTATAIAATPHCTIVTEIEARLSAATRRATIQRG
jgi:hypothetical protein